MLIILFSFLNFFFSFQGKWEARKIPNPDYFEESHPYKLTPIGTVALELWSMVDGVVFDNFIITSDQSLAKQYGDQIWYPKTNLETKAISSASDSVIDAIVRATKDRPWLWAVCLVAILLPLVILFVFCWSRKPTKKKTVDGLKKKTDESEPDTTEQQTLLTRNDEEDDEEAEEIEIDEQPKTTTSNITGKDALENEDEVVEEEVEVNEDETNKNSSPSAANKARRRLRKE